MKARLASCLVALALLVGVGCGGSSNKNDAASSGGSTASGGSTSSGGDTAKGGAAGAAGENGAGESNTAGAGGSDPIVLDQTGNPVFEKVRTYASWLAVGGDAAMRLAADVVMADNMLTWQLPNGGFYKNAKTVYAAPWDGVAPRSGWHGADEVELGTIDNAGTVTELMFLADVYKRSSDVRYRDAVRLGIEFLLGMQYPSGGFPQVYPARVGTTYSNYVTFNDDAMVRVLALFDESLRLVSPLDGDVITDEQRARMDEAITKAVDYILKAQIVQGDVKTVWCAQHDPESYAATGARSYELPSKSGKESISIIAFLMTRPQTPEVVESVKAAIAWYKSSTVKVADTTYLKRAASNTDDSYNPIQPSVGKTMWYRFYDLDQDVGFFSGRLATDSPPGTGKQYDIMLVEPERRYGYEWGGSYGTSLFAYTDRVGY